MFVFSSTLTIFSPASKHIATEESVRHKAWNNKNTNYGSLKINDARIKYGIDNLTYDILENHYDEDVGPRLSLHAVC